MRPSFLACAVLSLVGCSSQPGVYHGPSEKTGPSSTVTGNVTWTDGMVIAQPTVIDASATVTIAAGATIHVESGVTITVAGTLKSAGGAQAKLTGASWAGVIVSAGGTLALDGVDLENASTGIDIEAKPASASYDHGTITAPTSAFTVEADGVLTTTHATVVGCKGPSHVAGSFTATFLDYDANGNDGISSENDNAVVSIEDSHLHGTGGNSDMIVSYTGASRIHVAYTEIKNVHCAFHLERVTNLDVSYVNATGNSFGAMLYGSLNDGTRTVSNSNLYSNFQWGIDEADFANNGLITVTNTYVAQNTLGDVHLHTNSSIKIVDAAASMVQGAGPR